jgi:hypothetical protein
MPYIIGAGVVLGVARESVDLPSDEMRLVSCFTPYTARNFVYGRAPSIGQAVDSGA